MRLLPNGVAVRRWLETVRQDVRFGVRSLRRSPLATTVMVGSVSLGIGVATAVFTLADVMLFRKLPYRDSERLVVPYQTVAVRAGARRDTVEWTVARYDVLRKTVSGFEDAGFATWVDGIIRAGDEDRPVRIEAITPSLLTTLSVGVQRGRAFGNDENDAGAPQTVGLISERLWRNVYGGDPAILGGHITLDGTPVTVVGIMPAGFSGFSVGADVWLPLLMMARIDPSPRWTEKLATESGTVIARMAPGLTTALIQKQLDAALPIIDQVSTEQQFAAADAERGIGVIELAEARRHPLVRPILSLMGVAVLGLVLTVCANIASILLARGHARRNELGIRIALGASNRRVSRQLLTESTLLGALGLPPGILVGYFCADALVKLRPALPQTWVLLRGTDMLAGVSLAPNLRVLLFSAGLTVLSTLLFGIGPAVAASRIDAAKLITSAGDSHTSAPVRGRQFLVIAQVALATILLVTAGLMTRSLRALLDTNLGFQPNGVVALRLSSIDTSAAARIRRQQAIDAVMEVRGVRAVSMSRCLPFDLACLVTVPVRGVDDADGSARAVELEYHPATPGYFRTMGIPIVAGRPLVAEDTTVGRIRVVISEAAARRLFGTEAAAIGKQIVSSGDRGLPMDVVGVARNVRFRSVDAADTPALYRIVGEDVTAPRLTSTLLVRTSTPTGVAISSVTRALRESGAPLGVSDAQPLTNVVRSVTSSTRFVATLLIGFAASAVLLAGLGIYGVIAFIVTQRAREFGVRLVLGADGRRLLGSVVRRGAGLVAAGVAAGAVLAVGATRIVRSLLYGVGSFDVATYLVVASIVGVTGLLATFIPARRIAYIDPADALRG